MIRSYFGLTQDPFALRDIQLLSHQQEIHDTLRVHSQQGGLCLVVGRPGTGKSVIKESLRQLPEKDYLVACVARTLHTYTNTVKILCEAFKIKFESSAFKCERKLIEQAFSCYRPRSGCRTRLFRTELLSQPGDILTSLIRYIFARPRSPHLAPRFSFKYTVPRFDPAPFDIRCRQTFWFFPRNWRAPRWRSGFSLRGSNATRNSHCSNVRLAPTASTAEHSTDMDTSRATTSRTSSKRASAPYGSFAAIVAAQTAVAEPSASGSRTRSSVCSSTRKASGSSLSKPQQRATNPGHSKHSGAL